MRSLLIGIGAFLADQAAKAAVLAWLQPGQSITVIPHVLSLTHARNPGAAFGILPNRTPFFILVTVLLVAVMFAYLRREREPAPAMAAGVGLALGGALGNLVDRLRWGSVVDFLDFHVWPVFNLADIALTAGVVLLAWHMLRSAEPG